MKRTDREIENKDCYLTRKFDNYTRIIQVDTEVSSEISKGSETL